MGTKNKIILERHWIFYIYYEKKQPKYEFIPIKYATRY